MRFKKTIIFTIIILVLLITTLIIDIIMNNYINVNDDKNNQVVFNEITISDNKNEKTSDENQNKDKNNNSEYYLMLDVSQFNIIGYDVENNPDNKFRDTNDFINFVKDNNIKYVYIRIGGRGWGQAGTLYEDDRYLEFVDACNQNKIEYGFYFIEEATNEDEIIEEINFINELKSRCSLEYNKLPLALDMEYQFGRGRTDNIWEQRTNLINYFIDNYNGDVIVYVNGARGQKYLKNIKCKIWVAMYPEDNRIPNMFYKDYVLNEMQKEYNVLMTDLNKCGTDTIKYDTDFLDKICIWQFTENGAKDNNINSRVDISIFEKKD